MNTRESPAARPAPTTPRAGAPNSPNTSAQHTTALKMLPRINAITAGATMPRPARYWRFTVNSKKPRGSRRLHVCEARGLARELFVLTERAQRRLGREPAACQRHGQEQRQDHAALKRECDSDPIAGAVRLADQRVRSEHDAIRDQHRAVDPDVAERHRSERLRAGAADNHRFDHADQHHADLSRGKRHAERHHGSQLFRDALRSPAEPQRLSRLSSDAAPSIERPRSGSTCGS